MEGVSVFPIEGSCPFLVNRCSDSEAHVWGNRTNGTVSADMGSNNKPLKKCKIVSLAVSIVQKAEDLLISSVLFILLIEIQR